MRLTNNNSTAMASVESVAYYRFYHEEDEYNVTVECPVCDGDGNVYYTDVEDCDNEQRFDCPHCNGDGEIETTVYVEEIEEEEQDERSWEATPYEDNNLDFRQTRAYDSLGRTEENGLTKLVKRFLDNPQNKEKADLLRKEREDKKQIALQEQAVKEMISNLFAEMKTTEDTKEIVEMVSRMM